MTALCSKGTETKSSTSSGDFSRQVLIIPPSLFYFSHFLFGPVTAGCMTAAPSYPQVSSVTQTTATEKEVLSQLLQEKDQLQREQEDRIKNLTKLLVTSSNQGPVQKVTIKLLVKDFLLHHPSPADSRVHLKMPKRRVTWGGKMLRLACPSTCGPSDLSFAGPFTRKRKADRSCLMELAEGKNK